MKRGLFLFLLLTLLAGCADGWLLRGSRERVAELAASKGFAADLVPAGPFVLQVFHRGLHENPHVLVVYVEGDGHAWATPWSVSKDPTPWNPVALRLAVRDPSPAVLYVARPCQYTRGDDRAGCDPRFWASDRYGEKVVQAVNAAIDWAQDAARAPRIGLVGYSGGGAVAALVAARRDDVAWLATVAGNLDHATWTRLLDLTPLSGSLNPVDEAARLRLLAQLHLVGGDDETMPAAVAQAYARKLARPDRVHVVIVPGFDHKCCWVRDWPEVLCRYQFWGLPYCAPAAGQGADVVRPGARRPAG